MEKVWVSRWVPETELGEEFGLREAVSPPETRQEAAVTSEQGLLGPGQRHWEWAVEDGMGESVEESGKDVGRPLLAGEAQEGPGSQSLRELPSGRGAGTGAPCSPSNKRDEPRRLAWRGLQSPAPQA